MDIATVPEVIDEVVAATIILEDASSALGEERAATEACANAESVFTKVPTWDPSDYMVIVNPEYLLPATATQTSQDSRDEQGGEAQKGSNKRPRDYRPNGLEKLCGQSRKGEPCPFGDACRFR